MVEFPVTLNSYSVGLVNIYYVMMLAEVLVKVLVKVLAILAKKKYWWKYWQYFSYEVLISVFAILF